MGFSVLAGKAKALQDKLGVTATQKTKEDLREELVNTLLKTSADHLVSDAPQPVVLANQVPPQVVSWDGSNWTQTSPPPVILDAGKLFMLIEKVLREELADRLPQLGLKSSEAEV